MLYLGIDQHAKQLTVSLRNGAGDVILKRQVSTDPQRCLEFFVKLQERIVMSRYSSSFSNTVSTNSPNPSESIE